MERTMRTIKFRGKNFLDKWFYGSLIINESENERGMFPVAFIVQELPCGFDGKNRYTARMERVKVKTIEQFTGLTDKNGKEIYEGDIVKFTKWNGELTTGLVKWDDCNPCMCIEYKTEYKQTDWEYDFLKCGSMIIEVVGNIYDNPELLKD